jgi:23S rRNA (pseudouridine1915-N3)-methyltransferase
MWELLVITVGKVSDKGFRQGVERYAAMMGGDWRVRLESVSPSRRKDPAMCKREETQALLGRLPDGRVCMALDPDGEAMTSEGFGAHLARLKDAGRKPVFLVGGAHGLDGSLLEPDHRRLSLSAMTFPHELALLMLMEQLYRAQARYTGKPYAK